MTISPWPEWLPDQADFGNAGSPVIKNVIRSVRYKDCRRIAELALNKKTAQEIEEFVIESVAMRFPEGLVSQNTT